MLTVVVIMTIGAAVLGAVLGWASVHFRVEGNPLVDNIDALLPQTQCGQCGYPGCKPYAEAIAEGTAQINLCVPGGEAAMQAMADLLGRDAASLSTVEKLPQFALIDETRCIGCTLCFQACPVDAVVGAAKQLHTVIQSVCTGCERCTKSCPTKSIHMNVIPVTIENWKWDIGIRKIG